MKIFKYFPCFDGECYSLIGTHQLSLPRTSWTCKLCKRANSKNRRFCSVCKTACENSNNDWKINNRAIKVPSWASYWYFAEKDLDFVSFFTDHEITSRNFHNIPIRSGACSLNVRSDYYPVSINFDENEIEVKVFEPNEQLHTRLIGKLKPNESKLKKYCDSVFDFLKFRYFEVEGSLLCVTRWKVTDTARTRKLNSLHTKPAKKNKVNPISIMRDSSVNYEFEKSVPKIFYDLETFTDPENANELIPYCVAFYSTDLKIEKSFINKRKLKCIKRHCEWTHFSSQQRFDDEYCSCLGEAAGLVEGLSYLASEVLNVFKSRIHSKVKVIGFNNYNFDDEFIHHLFENCLITQVRLIGWPFQIIDKQDYSSKLISSKNTRFNKTTRRAYTIIDEYNVTFQEYIIPSHDEDEGDEEIIPEGTMIKDLTREQLLLIEEIYKEKLEVTKEYTIEFMDCVKFVPDVSLAQACKDYEIKNAKIGLDSVAVGNLIYDLKCIPDVYILNDGAKFEDILSKGIPFQEKVKLERMFYDKKNKSVYLKKAIEYYCVFDVKATEELYNKIQDSLCQLVTTTVAKNDWRHPDEFVSISHFSYYLFTKLCPNFVPHDFPREIDSAIKSSMFGGRCDFSFTGEYTSKDSLCYWDVTSEYPLAMTADYPMGEVLQLEVPEFQAKIDEVHRRRNIQFENKLANDNDIGYFNIIDKIFFATVDAFPPNEGRLITWAPIPTRLNLDGEVAEEIENCTRLGFFNLPLRKRYLNSIQIKTLLYGGWTVKILEDERNIRFSDKGKTLLPYVEIIGKLKAEARDTNKSYAKVLKLVLNSLPGKLGQKSKHVVGEQKFEFRLFPKEFEINTTGKTRADILAAKQGRGLVHRKYRQFHGEEIDSKTVVNCATEQTTDRNDHFMASLIWAYANFIMWTTMFKLHINTIDDNKKITEKTGIVLYCDTDSIVMDTKCITPYNFVTSEEIGRWNDEKHEFDATWKCKHQNFDSLIVLAKKSYFCLKNDVIITRKLKGIPSKEMIQFTLPRMRQMIADRAAGVNPQAIKQTVTFKMLKRTGKGDKVWEINKNIHQIESKKSVDFSKFYDSIKNENPINYEFNREHTTEFCASRYGDRRFFDFRDYGGSDSEDELEPGHSSERADDEDRRIRACHAIRNYEHGQDLYIQKAYGGQNI